MRRQRNAERPWRHSHAERGNDQKSGRLSGRLALAFDLGAPLTTMAERRHCAVGKPAGRRFSRAGPWMAHRGDPRSNAFVLACRALARHRVVGQSLLVPFCWAGTPAFEKGTRCKSETIRSRYSRNGYVRRPQPTVSRAAAYESASLYQSPNAAQPYACSHTNAPRAKSPAVQNAGPGA